MMFAVIFCNTVLTFMIKVDFVPENQNVCVSSVKISSLK